ncbi:MAG TPA: ATP-binding cassette domain-containing protein [Lacibacter sp.]|nr:ATP-binding cassette domain-containing protein [Lacibacter sp.]HMO87798.1 ATP-binding cassette domain-containing protein [Lacibacter sp.]HMP86355.1 ATP-binding cassette domain-containing protein [Lacibacter sp.]
MQTILEVQRLKKYFSSQKAVDDISFSLHQGSIFGLLGPNGAGKTTLIRMITGIFYPDEGTILLNGRRFNPVEDVIDIGYMPEERGLYKKMKVGEQALYLAQLKGLSRSDAFEKVKLWFDKFEMSSWWNKKVEDLSKGMSQKLQFVTTVLHEPRLVILDEPFSGLDPVNSNLIKDEIYALAQKGTTIIFSTHRMEQVEEICDHIILVNKGQKILDGGVAEVKQQFKEHLFKLELGSEGADLEHPSFYVVGKEGRELTVKIHEGHTANEVLLHFIAQQQQIVVFHEILPSLNDIFIHLVEGTPTARQFETVTA